MTLESLTKRKLTENLLDMLQVQWTCGAVRPYT